MSDLPTDPAAAPGLRAAADPLRLALREQEVVLDHAGVGIVFIKRRTIARCNQRFTEIYGFESPAAAIGRLSESLYPDSQAFHDLGAAAYPVMAAGQPYKGEVLMRRLNGEEFWTHLTGTLVNPANTDEGSIWIVDDISGQRGAQAQLKSVLFEQQLILDNAMVGIAFLRNRKVTRCNQAFEQLFGYAPGELDGSSSRKWYLTEEDWMDGGQR